MSQKIYQVDAFTDKVFSGNPAAVCPLDNWLADELLQKIAKENNLAETAFYVKEKDQYQLRWFTPKLEVDLCGHATLAAAFVLFNFEGHKGDKIQFHSHRSGRLTVVKQSQLLTLNFPADVFHEIELTKAIADGFNFPPTATFKGKTDYLLIYDSESDIRALKPNLDAIEALKGRGVIVTARGEHVDFVSRFFAPQSGIDEDPVTGSAHTTLTPYWSKVLDKKDMTAIQLSERKGYLKCTYLKERVEISGQCALYLTGSINLD
ncbi:PhzF family phenazine biosynthesis protein [Flavobacteriaceae bacterium KMM 6898]|nr:PhzF family phenazine biosynthesis protein [Flavobacteriaceae bacterium KMM 6898]